MSLQAKHLGKFKRHSSMQPLAPWIGIVKTHNGRGLVVAESYDRGCTKRSRWRLSLAAKLDSVLSRLSLLIEFPTPSWLKLKMLFEVVQRSEHLFVAQWLRDPTSPVLAFKCPNHEIVIQAA